MPIIPVRWFNGVERDNARTITVAVLQAVRRCLDNSGPLLVVYGDTVMTALDLDALVAPHAGKLVHLGHSANGPLDLVATLFPSELLRTPFLRQALMMTASMDVGGHGPTPMQVIAGTAAQFGIQSVHEKGFTV